MLHLQAVTDVDQYLSDWAVHISIGAEAICLDTFWCGLLSVSRCSAPIPATVTLSSPECVWTGCLGFRKHYRWVVGLFSMYAQVSKSLLTYVDSTGFGQVMVRSAGIMSSLWVWSSLCCLLSAPLSRLPSFAMSPGLSLTSAATRTHRHPWRRCKRWVHRCSPLYPFQAPEDAVSVILSESGNSLSVASLALLTWGISSYKAVFIGNWSLYCFL